MDQIEINVTACDVDAQYQILSEFVK